MLLQAVVLSYNHPELTEKAVRSVLVFLPEEQVTLVHNGSEARFVERLKRSFPRLSHLVMPRNQGFSGGANLGIRHVLSMRPHCEWIFFMTNDCEVRAMGALPNDPMLVAPVIMRRSEKAVDSIGGRYCLRTGNLFHMQSAEDFASLPRDQRYVPGSSFLVHRYVFETLDGFDENLHTYWEDVDFSFRAQQAGVRVEAALDYRLVHGVGKTCRKKAFYTVFLYHRNRLRVTRRHARLVLDLRQRWRLHLYQVWQNLRFLGYLLRRKRAADLILFLRAVKEGYSGNPRGRCR